MKWIKRLVLAAIATVAVPAGIGYRTFRQAPEFYRRYDWDDQKRGQINQQAADKLLSARQLAQQSHFEGVRARRAGQTLPTTQTEPARLILSEEELNALLLHNADAAPSLRHRMEQYVRSPGIYLREGRIILAAEVPRLSTVMSVQFVPALGDRGLLRLSIDGTQAGRLPVPRAVVEIQLRHLRGMIEARLPQLRSDARIDSFGAVNGSAAAAAMSMLLLDLISDRSADAVIYMPVDEKGTSVPLRITGLSIVEDQLTLDVLPVLDAAERSRLFDRIRESP